MEVLRAEVSGHTPGESGLLTLPTPQVLTLPELPCWVARFSTQQAQA